MILDDEDEDIDTPVHEEKEQVYESQIEAFAPVASSQQNLKVNKLIKEFNNILHTTPAKIGDVALGNWMKLGPFNLQK